MSAHRLDTSVPPYHIVHPTAPLRPILVSVPHCGTAFPDDIRDLYAPQHTQHPEDTDWFVHQLYDFAPHLGITLIYAHYSRYVIDINRDPEGKPLYNDGRVITELVPTRTFADQPLYLGAPPDQHAIQERKTRYFEPYHQQIDLLITQLRQQFPRVLLWDAHSIRRYVPTIRTQPFPDLILGDQDGKTAASALIELAQTHLSNGPYALSHNEPFKGGYITRHFGRPHQSVHALQLEMAKTLYMDEDTTTYEPTRAQTIRQILQNTLIALADLLDSPATL